MRQCISLNIVLALFHLISRLLTCTIAPCSIWLLIMITLQNRTHFLENNGVSRPLTPLWCWLGVASTETKNRQFVTLAWIRVPFRGVLRPSPLEIIDTCTVGLSPGVTNALFSTRKNIYGILTGRCSCTHWETIGCRDCGPCSHRRQWVGLSLILARIEHNTLLPLEGC